MLSRMIYNAVKPGFITAKACGLAEAACFHSGFALFSYFANYPRKHGTHRNVFSDCQCAQKKKAGSSHSERMVVGRAQSNYGTGVGAGGAGVGGFKGAGRGGAAFSEPRKLTISRSPA